MDGLHGSGCKGAAMGCFAGVDFRRGRLFQTADLDEAREVCGRVFNPHRLRVVGPGQSLWSCMDHLPLGPMSLNRLSWGAHVHVDPDRLGTYYLISIPVRGAARFHLDGDSIDVSPRRACIVSAGQRFRFEADAQFDQVVLRLEKTAVEAAWTALTGEPPAAPVALQPSLPLDGPAWRALEPALQMLATCAGNGYAPGVAAHVQARLQDMLLTSLLLHRAPALAPVRAAGVPGASAALVRRVRSMMLEHLEDPLTLGHVARAAGVATRTLQGAFHAECGMGPMQWLREQRLLAVHRTLQASRDPGTRVTDTALAFGFSHLGEFGRAYRRRFGESPSQTLARRISPEFPLL